MADIDYGIESDSEKPKDTVWKTKILLITQWIMHQVSIHHRSNQSPQKKKNQSPQE